MTAKPIAVLGGGNTAFAVAARLSLQGVDIVLCEHPDFAENLVPIGADGIIRLKEGNEEQAASIHLVTADIAETLDRVDLALVIVPAYAHRPFAQWCLPHLRQGHTVVLMPGTLGSLEWAHLLRQGGKDGVVTLAEVDTAPYVCRKTAPDEATIWGVVSTLGLGVLPARQTDQVRGLLEPLFAGIESYGNVVGCGLAAMNPVVHPAGVLMNAGRLEYARGEFYFYEEGVTPAVVRVIEQVDAERRQLGQALGCELAPVHEAFSRAGFGPVGDLWSTINGSWMLTRLKAPGSLESRWLTEDIPYGLAAWSSLGRQYGIETPTMDALVGLGSTVMGFDARQRGRGVARLGIEGLEREGLATFLDSGVLP